MSLPARFATVALIALSSLCAVADPVAGAAGTGLLVDHGSTTFDTRTGRSWLDLSLSAGVSYDNLKRDWNCNPECASGPFAGWQFAQREDVRDLLADFGLGYGVDYGLEPDLPAHIVQLNAFITLLGGHVVFDDFPGGCGVGCGGLSGLIDERLPAGSGWPDEFTGFVTQASVGSISCCGDWWVGDSLTGPTAVISYRAVFPRERSTPNSNDGDPYFTNGVWLFQVPEPASLTLLAAGLGWLGWSRRRRSMSGWLQPHA